MTDTVCIKKEDEAIKVTDMVCVKKEGETGKVTYTVCVKRNLLLKKSYKVSNDHIFVFVY